MPALKTMGKEGKRGSERGVKIASSA